MQLKTNASTYRRRFASGDDGEDDLEEKDEQSRNKHNSGNSGLNSGDDNSSDSQSSIFDEKTAIEIIQESLETNLRVENAAMFGSEFASGLIDFLKLILDNYNDIHQVLKLKNFPDVYNVLEGRAKQGFGKLIIKNIVDCNTSISDPEEADTILKLTIAPLLSETASVEDQAEIGTLLNLLRSDDLLSHYYILEAVKKHLKCARMVTLGDALPTLVFSALELVEKECSQIKVDKLVEEDMKDVENGMENVRIDAENARIEEISEQDEILENDKISGNNPEIDENGENKQNQAECTEIVDKYVLEEESENEPEPEKSNLPDIFREFIAPCINSLYNEDNVSNAALALRLYLQCAISCDRIKQHSSSNITYDFFSQALEIYEDVLPDTKTQAGTIPIFVGSLEKIKYLSSEEHEALRQQIVQLATRLFRKPDQVHSILAATHAFWSSCVFETGVDQPIRDSGQVCKLLNKCLKTSCQVLERAGRIECLLSILHKGVYFKTQGCEGIEEVMGVVFEKMEFNMQEAERDDSFQLSENAKNLYVYVKSVL